MAPAAALMHLVAEAAFARRCLPSVAEVASNHPDLEVKPFKKSVIDIDYNEMSLKSPDVKRQIHRERLTKAQTGDWRTTHDAKLQQLLETTERLSDTVGDMSPTTASSATAARSGDAALRVEVQTLGAKVDGLAATLATVVGKLDALAAKQP